MFGTKPLPHSFSALFGRLTLCVAGVFAGLWVAAFAFGTVLILPQWRAGDAQAVLVLSLQTLVPLMVLALFGSIATLGAYGISQREARGRTCGPTSTGGL